MRDTWETYENLEPGEYYMFVEFDWPEDQEYTEFAVAYYGKEYGERRSWTAGGPSGLRKKDIRRHQRPGRAAEALQIFIPNHAFKFR